MPRPTMGGMSSQMARDFGAVRRFGLGLPPVTATVLACQVVTFLLQFFLGSPRLFYLLLFQPEVALAQPWTALTYPLVAIPAFVALLFSGFIWWWVGNDLERRWGSGEFGLVCLSVTLLTAAAFTLAGRRGPLEAVARWSAAQARRAVVRGPAVPTGDGLTR